MVDSAKGKPKGFATSTKKEEIVAKEAILYNVPFIFDDSTTLNKHGIAEGPHRPPALDRNIFATFCQHFMKTLFGQDV